MGFLLHDGTLRVITKKRTNSGPLSASTRKHSIYTIKLGKKALTAIASVARPDTILAWNRKFPNPHVDTSKPPRSVGRPRVDKEAEELVIRMARENRSWDYDRMQGALNHLGYTICDQTVGNILKRHGISPAPQRKETVTWREFVRIHLEVLGATDFFNSNVWRWFGRVIFFLLSVIHVGRHQVCSVIHQTIQAMRSLRQHARALSAYGSRGGGFLEAFARSPALRCGAALRGCIASGFVVREEQRSRSSPDRGLVVVLAMVHPRPIRDGPSRECSRQRGQLVYNQRKAA
jgi:transposase